MAFSKPIDTIVDREEKTVTLKLTEKQWGMDHCPQCGKISPLDLELITSPRGQDWTCEHCGAKNHSHVTVFTATYAGFSENPWNEQLKRVKRGESKEDKPE